MEGNDFQDWAYVLNSLGLPHVQLSPLRISYRSTAPIMEVAHAVLGPLAPSEPPMVPRSGPPVELFRFQSQGEAYAFLAEQLHRLMDEEPHASVALLARYGSRANSAWEALQRADVPRLSRVHDQDFSFAPGIEVTEIHQVKGLEFDYVVVLDAESTTYPATDSSRHLLHVAITRAAHMCWLLSVGTPSTTLPTELSQLTDLEK
ncbi:MAG: 3'-5' exonuclease [Myxococcota bacterium]